jgi:hypothetical protein
MTIQPNESAESVAIRTQRRILMQRLNAAFPARMFVKTLWQHAVYVEPTYEKSMFVKDVFYLQKKGYIEIHTNCLNEGCDLLDRFIMLTAEGKEIAEQTMTDPAMKI